MSIASHAPPLEDASAVAGNGIRLGGAWRNFSERISVLENENKALQERIAGLTEDRDSLLTERADMAVRFHDSVSSLTQEFSGHLKSLQIIETVRQEKLSLSKKVESFEVLCADLSADLERASNEITMYKQECCNWKATARAKETLLEVERAETVELRDMMYKKDEQIEAYGKRIETQDSDMDTMRRAIVTKDRQLVLLVKERDRYKNEIKAAVKGKRASSDSRSIHERPEFDLSNICSLSFIETPLSPNSPSRNYAKTSSPMAAPKFTEGFVLASPPMSPFVTFSKSAIVLDTNRSPAGFNESSEREYKAIIRKLRADLDAAYAIINKSNVKVGSRTAKTTR